VGWVLRRINRVLKRKIDIPFLYFFTMDYFSSFAGLSFDVNIFPYMFTYMFLLDLPRSCSPSTTVLKNKFI
jgi:hypothetical protein